MGSSNQAMNRVRTHARFATPLTRHRPIPPIRRLRGTGVTRISPAAPRTATPRLPDLPEVTGPPRNQRSTHHKIQPSSRSTRRRCGSHSGRGGVRSCRPRCEIVAVNAQSTNNVPGRIVHAVGEPGEDGRVAKQVREPVEIQGAGRLLVDELTVEVDSPPEETGPGRRCRWVLIATE